MISTVYLNMGSSFEISGGNRKVSVEGSLREDGVIRVHIDGVKHELSSSEGNFVLKGGKATLNCKDGSHVEEKDAYTEIYLSDGTTIYRGPIKKYATFADGSHIEQETSGIPSREDVVEVAKPNPFVFLMIIFGLLTQSPFFIVLATVMYLGESGYALRHYAKRVFGGEEDTESEVAKIQQRYIDDQITEDEFEQELEDYFSDDRATEKVDSIREKQFEMEEN